MAATTLKLKQTALPNKKGQLWDIKCPVAAQLPRNIKLLSQIHRVELPIFSHTLENTGLASRLLFGQRDILTFTCAGVPHNVDAFDRDVRKHLEKIIKTTTPAEGSHYDLTSPAKENLLKKVSQAALVAGVTLENLQREKLPKPSFFAPRMERTTFTPKGLPGCLSEFHESMTTLLRDNPTIVETTEHEISPDR